MPKIITGVNTKDAFRTPVFPFSSTKKHKKHTIQDAKKRGVCVYSLIRSDAPVIITENDTNKKRYVSNIENSAKIGFDIFSIYLYGDEIFSSFILLATKNTYNPNINDEKIIPDMLFVPNLAKNDEISLPVANPAPIIAPSIQNAVLNAFFTNITSFYI